MQSYFFQNTGTICFINALCRTVTLTLLVQTEIEMHKYDRTIKEVQLLMDFEIHMKVYFPNL